MREDACEGSLFHRYDSDGGEKCHFLVYGRLFLSVPYL